MKKQYRDQYRKFGLNVVYYRKALRVTQLQLAEMLDIERSHISAIELGNVGVSMDLIFKMCEVFGIKPRELFDFRNLMCFSTGRRPRGGRWRRTSSLGPSLR